ncbi:MAG: AAA family ATPase [Elusimicrobiales bacterium]|jgi:type II secretory pathway predicted ATPase ExeA|nr:AAA family ATPase [Elusimicrobiales bacterium]
MYLKHWNLRKPPFENTPDTDFFYESEKHREASSRLRYVVEERKACAVLTGVYGCGKTLVLRALEREHKKKGCVFSFVNNPRLDDLGLLRMILHNFTGYNVPRSKEDVLMGLEKFVRETYNDGKHVVIAIDESQLIDNENVFEELRLLLNFQTETRFLVTLLLSGQPELREKLDSNKQFSQRITLSYNLPALDREETAAYVRHRLGVAGGSDGIFLPEALDLVHERSGGIPRWINNIANMSLLAAFSKGSPSVDAALVAEGAESARQ